MTVVELHCEIPVEEHLLELFAWSGWGPAFARSMETNHGANHRFEMAGARPTPNGHEVIRTMSFVDGGRIFSALAYGPLDAWLPVALAVAGSLMSVALSIPTNIDRLERWNLVRTANLQFYLPASWEVVATGDTEDGGTFVQARMSTASGQFAGALMVQRRPSASTTSDVDQLYGVLEVFAAIDRFELEGEPELVSGDIIENTLDDWVSSFRIRAMLDGAPFWARMGSRRIGDQTFELSAIGYVAGETTAVPRMRATRAFQIAATTLEVVQ